MKSNFTSLTPIEHFILLAKHLNIEIEGFEKENESLLKKRYLNENLEITKLGEAFCMLKCQSKVNFKDVIARNSNKENLALMNFLSIHCFKIAQKYDKLQASLDNTSK